MKFRMWHNIKQVTRAALLLALLPGSHVEAGETYGSVQVDAVASVYDGDTFRIIVVGWPPVVGNSMPVRILGIDTPEIRGACDREKRLARDARQFTARALRDAKTIELHNIRRDKYFRLLAEVRVDGELLGPKLIAAGLARNYQGGHRQSWCKEERVSP